MARQRSLRRVRADEQPGGHVATTDVSGSRVEALLGDDAEDLLTHPCVVDASTLQLPGPDFIDRVVVASDRPTTVLRNLQWLVPSGRPARTGHRLHSKTTRLNSRHS